jgi:hypothetical protein
MCGIGASLSPVEKSKRCWGAEELIRLPSPAQRPFGRRAAETGATGVVLDHAHCLQSHEDWRDGHVFYGLGNFIFGDIRGQKWPDLARRTAMANIEISPKCVEEVRFDYLCQKNNMPDWDNRKSRIRHHRQLSSCVRFPDRTYRLLYELERFFQLEIVACFLFIEKSGGHHPRAIWNTQALFLKDIKNPSQSI